VYKRGRNRLFDAYAAPSPDNFHEWRKRTKYLWYHVRILRPLWPAVLEELANEIHELSNLLGLDHDLAVFHENYPCAYSAPQVDENGGYTRAQMPLEVGTILVLRIRKGIGPRTSGAPKIVAAST
jgi:hypothetical protein